MVTPIDVFDYLDYRVFLRDFYAAAKDRNASFSYRSFARRIGVRTPGHLKRVMDGERSLTPAMTSRYAQALGFGEEESTWWGHLVRFNQATTLPERESEYERLTAFRRYRRAHRLDARYADYFSHWFIPATRELAYRADFQDDAGWVAERLVPTISKKQAKLALSTLHELGMLQRDASGACRPTDTIVSSGPAATAGLHIARYHRAMLSLAEQSMDRFPASERDISAMTLAVPRGSIGALKARLVEFRQELLGEYTGEAAEQIVQLNIQLFPLSRSRSEGET